MATQVQNRRGSTAEHSTFTGAVAEITVDTNKDTVVVHDGATAGGRPLLREDGSNSALALGSAATPSLKFTGDPNTGIYSPGADQLALSVNGSEGVRLTTTGLGIGTSSPANLLHIQGDATFDANAGGQFAIRGSTNSQNRFNFGFETTNNYAWIQAITAGTAYRPIALNPSGGNVGIGTTSPGVKLDCVASTTARAWTPNAGTTAIFENNGQSIGRSFVTIAGTSVGQTELWFADEVAEAVGRVRYDHAADAMSLWTAGTEKARIDSSGRLLVGTSSAFGTASTIEAHSSTQFGPQLLLRSKAADAFGPYFVGQKIRNTSSVQSGDYLSVVEGQGYDGSAYISAARLSIEVDGTPGANDMPGRLVFSTTADGASSPTERMRIDSSGRVGIGTTSPSQLLHVSTNSNASTTTALFENLNTGGLTYNQIQVKAGTNTATFGVGGSGTPGSAYLGSNQATDLNLFTSGASNIAFLTNSLERARIDSSGRLLVGTSSSRTGVNLQLEGTTYATSSASLFRNSTSFAEAPALLIGRSKGSTVGSATIVANNDILGTIGFAGTDGSGTVTAASISAFVDGTPGANDMPGRLVFSTTADGASSPTERMRISSAGATSINTGPTNVAVNTGTTDGATFYAPSAGAGILQLSNDGDICAYFRRRSSDGSILQFRRDTTSVGSISVTTTATAYNTSSDYRLKENVTPVTDGIVRLQQLKPSRFNFISDPSKTVDGFLAHEAQAVVPECVVGEKDAVDDEGNPVYQGIDQAKLVPLLTAALQEAVAKIESLEARLTAAGI